MESKQIDTQTTEKPTSWLNVVLAVGVMIFLVGLPFHLVVKKLVPGPVGTYWKEILLGLLVGVWVVQSLRQRRPLLSNTPIDAAVLVYLGLLILRFVLDRSGWTGAWGLYASVMYLPLFFLVPIALRRLPGQAYGLVVTMVIIGAVLALGGLAEFVLDKPLWPADELLERYGSYDAFIYGTHLRRVYFTFDSPTALANTLAMLLPLALALMLFVRRLKWRILAGLAALLIAGGIVVTYSRGIWVASVLALLFMGILGTIKQLNRRVWLVVAGVLVIIGLIGGLVAVMRPGESAPAYERVVELTQVSYQKATVISVVHDFLQVKPDFGEAAIQTWSLQDQMTRQTDQRIVIFEHPFENSKEEIIYQVSVPEKGAISFAITLSPEVWSPEKGDGVNFQLFVSETGSSSEGKFIFNRYINPKLNPNDRRWLNFIVDLSPWAGQTVNLSFITESGTSGNYNYDWAGWAEPKLITIDPEFFSANAPKDQNILVQRIRSIMDWAKDQSNQDRLIAWSTALNAWRQSPLWGTGIGTTGIAALRTHPESAFVTESQVLKALTELGLLGILTLGYLWFVIGRVGFITYYKSKSPAQQGLLLGILTSLIVVFIEGWVFQNLEIKQVNAYFWALVGLLAFCQSNYIADQSQGVEQT